MSCGASRIILGLVGDKRFIDGRSIFWDSNELEPAKKKTQKQKITHKSEESKELPMLLEMKTKHEQGRIFIGSAMLGSSFFNFFNFFS